MSNKIINKNFELSADFNRYVISHPEITAQLKSDSCVIFEDKSDKSLTKVNRRLAREIKKEGDECVIAIKDGKSWRVEFD